MNHSLYSITELGINLLEAAMIVWFISSYLGCRFRGARRVFGYFCGVALLFLSVTISNYLIVYEGPYLLVYVGLIFLYSCFFLNGPLLQKAYICVFSFMLTSVISTSSCAFFSLITDWSILDLMTLPTPSRYICIAVTKLLYLAVASAVLFLKRRKHISIDGVGWLFTGLIDLVSVLIVTFILGIATDSTGTQVSVIHIFLAILGVIAVNIISYYQFIKISRLSQQKFELTMLNREMEYYKNHLQDIKKLYGEIRATRHDMKNHLTCLSVLIQEGKYTEALDYIDCLKDMKVLRTRNYVETSMESLNCLLNSKITYCEENKIDVKPIISADLRPFSNLDLTVLLGNLLDNAIEACQQCDRPKIELAIFDRKNYLSISVSNTVAAPVLETNPDLHTTKQIPDYHGVGTTSIQNIVQRYQGMINYSEEKNVFICNILLNKSFCLPNRQV